MNFSEVPILPLIPEDQFATALLDIFVANRDEAMDILECLNDRRKSNNVELVNEAKWFITVASELKLQASSKSKLLSAQISLAVQWYLTPTAN